MLVDACEVRFDLDLLRVVSTNCEDDRGGLNGAHVAKNANSERLRLKLDNDIC